MRMLDLGHREHAASWSAPGIPARSHFGSDAAFRQGTAGSYHANLRGYGVTRLEHAPHATVVADEVFAFVIEHEVRTAVRMRYPVSLLAIRPPQQITDKLATVLSPILRRTDLIRRSRSDAGLHVLLVGAPLEALPGIIQRIAAEVEAHRLLGEGDEPDLTLSLGGACFPTSARSVTELVSRADALADLARRDPGGPLRYRLR